MQITLPSKLTQFAHPLQDELFPRLTASIGPISNRQALFIATCPIVPFSRYMPCGRLLRQHPEIAPGVEDECAVIQSE